MRAVSTQQRLECCVLTARTLLTQTLPRVKTLGLYMSSLQDSLLIIRSNLFAFITKWRKNCQLLIDSWKGENKSTAFAG